MLIVPTSLLIYSISDLMLIFSGHIDAESIGRFTLLGGLSTTLISLIGGGISINVISTWINSHKPETRPAGNGQGQQTNFH